eukprot:maker-scaffold319_size207808-snap-gene-0.21 protein:Tk00361 transcript:maker-scaffold319_size207808-snap-gene-0.21-mRNA-1 annotation:"p-type lysozyme"
MWKWAGIALLLATVTSRTPKPLGRHFKQAELVQYLNESNYEWIKEQLPMWMCIFCREANYYTGALDKESRNGFGLFQTQSGIWCEDGYEGGMCNMDCNDFLDANLDDDVECARTIVKKQGMHAWVTFSWTCSTLQSVSVEDAAAKMFMEDCTPLEDVDRSPLPVCPDCSNSQCYGSETQAVENFEDFCPYPSSSLSNF